MGGHSKNYHGGRVFQELPWIGGRGFVIVRAAVEGVVRGYEV